MLNYTLIYLILIVHTKLAVSNQKYFNVDPALGCLQL